MVDGKFLAMAERRECKDAVSVISTDTWTIASHFTTATTDLTPASRKAVAAASEWHEETKTSSTIVPPALISPLRSSTRMECPSPT